MSAAEPADNRHPDSGQFGPGNNANPGGRPKGLARKVRELVGNDGESIARFMLGVLDDPHADVRDRITAAGWLADRGWGKPTQGLEITGEEGGPMRFERIITPPADGDDPEPV